MRIPIVVNGGQWTHREYRVLRDLGADCVIVPNTASFEDAAGDGLVLSGGALSLEDSEAPLGRIGDWVEAVGVPVLGICVGHHFLGRHFGATVRGGGAEFGRVELTVDAPDHPLFRDLPTRLHVWENHNDQVTAPPAGWKALAHSEAVPVQAMAHPTRPIFGVQFHPEVDHTEGGREIFRHFLELCRR